MTFKAKFVKDGTYAYDMVQFGGNVGGITGFKAGAFSISLNQRKLDHSLHLTYTLRQTLQFFIPETKVPLGLIENLLLMFTGFNEISWTIRDTLDQCDNFECAHKKLSTELISSVGYIILAGTQPGQGVVITRNRFNTDHEDWIIENSNFTKWYVV